MRRCAVLATGGAGYVGSHAVLALLEADWPVVVLDDLSTGRGGSLPEGVPLIEGDVGDRDLLGRIFRDHAIGAVLHFAASIVVPESIARPLTYYHNNAIKSHALLEAMLAAGIDVLVFSSTAAVYGNPDAVPVTEDAPLQPLNPYGWSKLVTEQMIRDVSATHRLRHVILRYFNVAGADAEARTGPAMPGATHLIKVACEAAVGKRAEVPLFGQDYPTPDGTCIRDYIHVSDLADAHLRALEHLVSGGTSRTLNCGYGRGHSVREVLDTVTRLAGHPLRITPRPRRPGDAIEVVAAADRIRKELRWRPRHDDLEHIVRDALAFERRLALER